MDVKLYHNNPNLLTLSDFAKFYNLKATTDKALKSILKNNAKLLWKQYAEEEKQEIAKKLGKKKQDVKPETDLKLSDRLPCPSYFIVDSSLLTYTTADKHTNFQASTKDAIAFQEKEIQRILNEPKTIEADHVSKFKPGCKVIGWFKSLYFDKQNDQNYLDIYKNHQDGYLDISRYVNAISTNVTEGGGSFSISLPHLPLYKVSKSETDMGFTFGSDDEFIIKSAHDNFDFFNYLIQPNDLIFIAFNDDQKSEDYNDNAAFMGKSRVEQKRMSNNNKTTPIYDMIALVESVTEAKDAQGNSTITIAGKDLMKLLSDDSSIYFPQGVSSGKKNIFSNTETTLSGGDLDSVMRFNGAIRDNSDGNAPRMMTPMLSIFAEETNGFTIDFVIKVIISHLANTRIVPDDIFNAWGDRRTKFSTMVKSNR